MTLQFVNVGARSTSAGATNLTPALPSITGRVGGRWVAVISIKSNAAITTAQPGWSAALFQDNSGAGFTTAVFTAPSTASAANFAWAGSVAAAAQVAYYEDADNPIDTITFGASSLGTGTVNPHTSASVNTTRQFSLMIAIDTAAANTALTVPAGWTLNNDEGSVTDGGRTAWLSRFVSVQGDPSGAISTNGAAAAWVQRQIELRIVLPTVGTQINGMEVAALMDSGLGVSASSTELATLLQSGNGISCSGMEIVYMMAPASGPVIKRRAYPQILM